MEAIIQILHFLVHQIASIIIMMIIIMAITATVTYVLFGLLGVVEGIVVYDGAVVLAGAVVGVVVLGAVAFDEGDVVVIGAPRTVRDSVAPLFPFRPSAHPVAKPTV